MGKILVAYFSATGKTKAAAELLAEVCEADIFEIKPQVLYTKKDLNWLNPLSRTTKEMHKKSFRPEMVKDSLNTEEYDRIFLCFPIWWYVAPTIVNTFLESYNFENKKIVLFATSGGSGFGKTVEGLKVSLPPSAEIVEGKMLNGKLETEELENFKTV